MESPAIFAHLRDVLATLYPDEASARRVVADAGLNYQRITFSTHAIDNWHGILTEAEKTGKIDALLDVTQREYGANQELQDAYDSYRHRIAQSSRRASLDLGASNEQKSWLKRLPQFLSGGIKDDVIIADVGEGAQEIVIGKNIVRIGTLVIPLLPLLIGVLLLLGTTGVASWLYFVPTQMSGLFNIAVAEFGEIDANGQVGRSESGKRLSEWVFKGLKQELESLPKEFVVSIWHDSLSFIEKRAQIGVIPGNTPAEREKAAAALAEKIDADIVIYGNLKLGSDPASFVPEFYVSALRNHAEEIIGRHQLGTAIPVRLPFDISDPVSALSLNKELSIRTKVLALFTSGLLYELIADPTSALDIFRQAEKEFGEWSKGSGKEVLYLFIGRVSLFLKHDEEALQAYQKALEINPNYARAYIGLGSYFYELAQRLPPEKRLETTYLEQSRVNYQRALDNVAKSPGAQLEIKSTLALGTVYRLKGESHLVLGEYDMANSLFDMSIERTDKVIVLAGEDMHQHLALAYLTLGAAYQQKAYILLTQGNNEQNKTLLEQALTAYEKCIEHADAVPHEWYQNLKTNLCTPYKKSIEATLTDMQEKN